MFIVVSILVVLDWTMMQIYDEGLARTIASFNPCFIGLDNDASHHRLFLLQAHRVSILVVLDWTMMPRHGRRRFHPMRSFNPCCIGLDNDAVGFGAIDLTHLGFQSLLYWIGQ